MKTQERAVRMDGIGNRRGQNTIEYILVVAAVIVALVAVMSTAMQPAVTQVVTDSGAAITAASGKISAGLGLTPTP